VETFNLGNLTVLEGDRKGKYPSANSILVKDEVCLLIDPSVDVDKAGRDSVSARVDVIVNSHAHEDHFAGNHLFPEAELRIHEQDASQMRSLDALMDAYGTPPAEKEAMRNRRALADFQEKIIEQRGRAALQKQQEATAKRLLKASGCPS